MTLGLIIIAAILVASVIVHYFLWMDSKRRYEENMKEAEAIKERIRQLETSTQEMDKMLDDAEEAIDRIDEGIEDLRSGRFMRREKPTFDN